MKFGEDPFVTCFGEKKYVLKVDDFFNLVFRLRERYFEKYHKDPNYIKLPVWVVIALERYQREMITYYCDDIYERELMGMKILMTESICSLNDIELFYAE